MPQPVAEAVVRPFADAAPSSGCPQVDAVDRQTAQISRLADELRLARETLTPAVEAITNLDSAQKKLCTFIVGHRLKLVAGGLGLLVAVGAISPNAAHAVSEALKVLGAQ